jgi:hypothetical protein
MVTQQEYNRISWHLGIWEEMYNADFNAAAYEEIMLEAGLNRFIMSVK